MKISSEFVKTYRIKKLENQTAFWSRFGISQSRGSRFELGKEIPYSVKLLIGLYINGVISDNDLQRNKE
jgi:hypothetical protein